jgi:hypothetical protein
MNKEGRSKQAPALSFFTLTKHSSGCTASDLRGGTFMGSGQNMRGQFFRRAIICTAITSAGFTAQAAKSGRDDLYGESAKRRGRPVRAAWACRWGVWKPVCTATITATGRRPPLPRENKRSF